MNAFYQTALSFTGQNMGAKKYERVGKIMRICVLSVAAVGTVLGSAGMIFARPLLSIYTTDPQVIEYGVNRMLLVCLPYMILWFFLSGACIIADDWLRHILFDEDKPVYRFI